MGLNDNIISLVVDKKYVLYIYLITSLMNKSSLKKGEYKDLWGTKLLSFAYFFSKSKFITDY